MARLIDLGEEEEVDQEADVAVGAVHDGTQTDDGRPELNIGLFSAALACYPIASQLSLYLDLNSLHELSRTCRALRAVLLLYRTRLIASALTCANAAVNPALRLGDALHASHRVWTAYGRDGVKIGRITSGKVGACARDLVGPCRRCSRVVCRNCVAKAPPSAAFRQRHRRLCRTCMKSPLDRLTTITRECRPCEDATDEESTSNLKTLARLPCTCHDTGVWVCQPCGQSRSTADTTYARGWAWRTRYSRNGGLGAGLGEGNEGVECGRGSDCLAASEVFKEIECDAAELAALEEEMSRAEIEGRHWEGSSYMTQEIVGIGGNIKKKVQKKVLVGATVKIYEDEREGSLFLGREQRGQNRSWCSWCERVVIGDKDAETGTRSTDSIASSSSSDPT